MTFGALLAAGSMLAHVDRRIGTGSRRMRLTVLGAAGAIAVAVLAAGIATGHSPRAVLAGARDDVEAELRTSRYGSSGSQSRRGEHWRVALGEFKKRPVEGMGADNFGVAYIRERQNDLEEPLYPHSLVVRVVSQTGLVGTAFFAVFLVAALSTALRGRPSGQTTRIAVVAALGPFVYWFIHGAADWLWEFPGLSLPALGFLALAGAVGREPRELDVRRQLGRATRLFAVAAAGALGLLASCVAHSFVAERPRAGGRSRDLAIGPLRVGSPLPPCAPAESAHRRAGRRSRCGRGSTRTPGRDAPGLRVRALERNPSSWYSHLELALVEAAQGRRAAALAQLEMARALNPTEQVLIHVQSRVRDGEAVPIREIDEIFDQRVVSLVR